jgi:hypothetical protein
MYGKGRSAFAGIHSDSEIVPQTKVRGTFAVYQPGICIKHGLFLLKTL